jgi:hypothetical protein
MDNCIQKENANNGFLTFPLLTNNSLVGSKTLKNRLMSTCPFRIVFSEQHVVDHSKVSLEKAGKAALHMGIFSIFNKMGPM